MTDLSRMTDDQLLALYQQGQPQPQSLAAPPAQLTPDALVRSGQQRQQEDAPLNWSDVPGQAVRNLPSSAWQFGKDIVEPFLSPVQTVKNIGTLGQGVAQKLGVSIGPDDPEATAAADAVGKFYSDRYGSGEGFKRALATDPVGVLGDASTVLSGGAGLAVRAPGAIGRAGQIAGSVGRAIDPLTVPMAATGLAARVGAGLTTGVGGDVLNAAREAGRESTAASVQLRDAMRGTTPMENIVTDARAALDDMRQAKQAAYRSDMRALARDKTILSWNDVDTAINDMNRVATFKGQPVSRSTEQVRNRIIDEIDNWKNLRASEYWTPEGFDALKKSINDIRETIPFENRQARLVAKQAADAIKQTIQKQSPGYAQTMRAYETASRWMDEVTRTFNLGERGTMDSALRKLTSAMRNNVNTNFGRRTQLIQQMNQRSPGLMNQITGASLNSWEPRGLARLAAGGGALAQGSAALMSGGLAPLATIPAQLAASSPRVAGELARGLGAGQRRFGRATSALIEGSRQYGRQDDR